MQDLRLVGVHEDGNHLLLSGTGGETFQLPIDEALRSAASRPPGRASAGASAPVAMSPRDIQTRIRNGATAADVAAMSGLPLAKVQRYEGPVLAEREYVAQQARRVEVASPAPGHDTYRAVFGDKPASLEQMVEHRLRMLGIDIAGLEWDSWRRPDGSWNVVAHFALQSDTPAGIGEEPPAKWTFNPARKALQNANRWAQLLSELESLDGPVPARRLSAVSDRPFDFETDAAAAARTATAQHNVIHQLLLQQDTPEEQDAEGLLDMLRSRRGHRLGVDEDADDALALLLSTGVPAAHPRPVDVESVAEPALVPAELPAGPAEAPEDTAAPDTADVAADGADTAEADQPDPLSRRRDARPSMLSRLTLAPRLPEEDDALRLQDGVSTKTREITFKASSLRSVGLGPTASPGLDELIGGGTSRRQQREPQEAAFEGRAKDHARADGVRDGRARDGHGSEDHAPIGRTGEETDAEAPERQPGKPKRSSIPSWDEIVFGARGD